MNGNYQGGFAPVKEGEEYDVNIEGVGEKGDGIARVKGFVVFIPGVKEGDQVRIKITKVLRKVGFGEVIGQAEKATETIEKPEEEPKEETTEEDKALFDESKDSEDFGEEDTESSDSEVQAEPEQTENTEKEEPAEKKPEKKSSKVKSKTKQPRKAKKKK